LEVEGAGGGGEAKGLRIMKNTLTPNPLPVDPAQVLWSPSPWFKNTAWHRALVAGDKDEARAAFLIDLREGPERTSLSTDIPALVERAGGGNKIGYMHGMRMEPDEVVRQHYVGVSGIEHTFEGEIDWLLDPTENLGERRDANWRATFNRHYHWVPLAERYQETGDSKYAHAFERELRSWIGQTSRPNDDGRKSPSCWRPIELGIRCGWTWPKAFEVFRRSKHVSDEALWLMVCSLSEQALQLLLWPTKLNIKTMETNGLIHVGIMFPELARARAFVNTGIDRACAELEHQVYDDGCQKELAPSYGILVLNNLFSGLHLAAEKRLDGECQIPPRARERLALMLRNFAEISTPDAKTPPIHDSPPHRVDTLYRDMARHLSGIIEPTLEPWRQTRFRHFPWGGWTVSCRNSAYALFDSGPWGGKHQHSDALQFVIHAGGRWLCIDPGKPIYNASRVTTHLKSSAAHNVVLMDGRCHLPDPFDSILLEPYPTWVEERGDVRACAARRHARTLADTDYSGQSSGFFHERCVVELEDAGWLVFDRLEPDDDGAHSWEWLWHTEADSLMLSKNSATLEFSGDKALWIQPVSDAPIEMREVGGQRKPFLRGWRSPGDFMEPIPAPTLQVCSKPATGSVVSVTLFALPLSNATEPLAEIAGVAWEKGRATIKVRSSGKERKVEFAWNNELEEIHVKGERFDVSPHSVVPCPE